MRSSQVLSCRKMIKSDLRSLAIIATAFDNVVTQSLSYWVCFPQRLQTMG
jgi:hypothetical protein